MIRFVVAFAIGAGLLLCHAEPSAGGVLTSAGDVLSSARVGAYGGTNIPIVEDDADTTQPQGGASIFSSPRSS